MARVFLQCCNVWWAGGTGLYTLDIVKAFPSFHHVITYRYQNNPDEHMMQKALKANVEILHMPVLTDKFMEYYKPCIGIIHSQSCGFMKLNEYPLINYHHTAVYPWTPTKYDVFCSKFVSDMYAGLHSRMRHTIIPPCIDTDYYRVQRLPKEKLVVGTVLSKSDANKMNKETINEIKHICAEFGLDYKIVGENVPFTNDLKNFYASIDILVHPLGNKKNETWGRVISEALASGAYVIASNAGGIPEQVIGNPIGRCIDSEKIPDTLREVLHKDAICSIIENNNQTRMDHIRKLCSLETLRLKLGPIIEQVINEV